LFFIFFFSARCPLIFAIMVNEELYCAFKPAL
jgi:hypothetical protein